MTDELDMSKARVITPTFDNRGNPVWRSVMSPPDDTFALVYAIPTRIIPVIFVPGVMGSNLKPLGKGEKWRMDSVLSAATWVNRGPKQRKQSLRPEAMEVDDDGWVPTDMALKPEELKRRGWGEIAAMSYEAALRWLEEHLNDFSHYRDGLRAQLMREVLGAELGEQPLTEDEVRLSYRYRFPVHACGYNWLDDNAASARRLGERIDEIIERYRLEKKRCEKVILVTHSMGGLVARYCSEVLQNERDKTSYRDKIFGIVHGVMPAVGAAAVYRRMKAGTENTAAGVFNRMVGAVASEVLGADAAEVTAVMSSAPGPLQLLPTPEYGNGWLRIQAGAKEVSLPQRGDPYAEIYAVRHQWWGLCDEQLINPLNEERDPRKRREQVERDWKVFAKIVTEVAAPFHEKITSRYHPHTHAFCGDSEQHKAYGSVSWSSVHHGDEPVQQWMQSPLVERKGTRWFDNTRHERAVSHPRNRLPVHFTISAPDEAGDGTVPRRSGAAPKAHCKSFLRTPVAHEPAYKPDEGEASLRALHFTVRAIVRIAQEVRHTSLMYEELRCSKTDV